MSLKFTKQDLKDGDEITYRIHRVGKVVYCKGLDSFMNKQGGRELSQYNENFIHNKHKNYDVIKVVRDNDIMFFNNEAKLEEIVKLNCEIKKFKGIKKNAEQKIIKYSYQIELLEDMTWE